MFSVRRSVFSFQLSGFSPQPSALSLPALVLAAGMLLGGPVVWGAEQRFAVGGVEMVLEEVSVEAQVFFRSMRLNRAAGEWNVEMVVVNRSGRVLPGPLVVGAFWLESSHQLQGPLETVLEPEGPIGAGEVAALVRWEESGLVWRVEQTVAGHGNGAVGVARELATAPSGPRVIVTVPANGESRVRASTPIIITFSEPVDPASFGPETVKVTNPLGVAVEGTTRLNLAGIEATFLPINPLEHAATFTVELAPTIRDRQGMAIEGELAFSFRTAAPCCAPRWSCSEKPCRSRPCAP